MKKETVFTKIILVAFLASGILLFNSCKEGSKTVIDKSGNELIELKTNNEKMASFDKNLLVGSWEDTSESALHFSLFADGTARSDNMKTLLYQSWRLENNKLVLTAKSIGNDTSSIDDEVYSVEELTENKMILKRGESIFEYHKIN